MIGNVVEWLGENLKELIPFEVIPVYDRGIRFWCGRIYEHKNHPWTGELGPGIWWRIPLIWRVDVVSIVPDVMNLPTQTYVTKDNKTISFSANIEYEIASIVAYYTGVQDFKNSLAGASMAHLARKVREWTLDELVEHPGELEKSLERTLTTRCKSWGVKINDVGLTDLAPTRAFRLYGDPLIP